MVAGKENPFNRLGPTKEQILIMRSSIAHFHRNLSQLRGYSGEKNEIN